jgi:hypothetical protein
VKLWYLTTFAFASLMAVAWAIFGRTSEITFLMGFGGILCVVGSQASSLRAAYKAWRSTEWRDPYAEIEARAQVEVKRTDHG